jgi:heme/copper-type cytochrome/quinol oxidase subunit 3
MTEGRRTVLDISALETSGFGHKTTSWWATIGFMLIEGMTLAICAATYLYLTRRFHSWPPLRTPPPDLIIPTISFVALLSTLPIARWVSRVARAYDVRGTQRALAVGSLASAVLLVLRALEFNSLNTRWDNDAYGSIVWLTVGLHTTLLLVDFVESFVIGLIFWLGPIEKKHFSDADDDAFYWYFMVAAWVPLYFLIYISPRLI